MPSLTEFNVADRGDAVALVRPCLDIERWVAAVVDGRPYPDLKALHAVAARPPTRSPRRVTAALQHHPRIGERASGASAEATLSRSEQSGVSADASATKAGSRATCLRGSASAMSS